MESLSNMREDLDPFSYAQANHCIALACIYTHIPFSWAEYQKKAIDVITRHGIQYVPRSPCIDSTKNDGSLVFTDADAERVVLLVQILYSEVDHFLVNGHSEGWCSELERNFRAQVFVRTSRSCSLDLVHEVVLIGFLSNLVGDLSYDNAAQEPYLCQGCEGVYELE